MRIEQLSHFLRQLWHCFLFYGMVLRFCWQGFSLAKIQPNSISKKVNAPRRECTYGPEGLCRLSRGLSNIGYNIYK